MATVAVVGAGVTGLVTAIGCARDGHRVVVFDRGPVPNPAATSSDQHRALRVLRPDDLDGTARMAEARRRWAELETLLRAGFVRPVGVVTAGTPDELERAFDTARQAGVPATALAPETLPPVLFPHGTSGVFDPGGAVLLADRFLRAAVGWLAAHPGVTLRPRCAVTGVQDHLVIADGEEFGADVILLAGGPWTSALGGPPVVLYRQTMAYLRPPPHLAAWWASAPGVGRIGADRRAWLLPPGGGTLLKISSDAVCREVATTEDPDREPWTGRLLSERLLAGDHTVVATKDCHYAADAVTGGPVLARIRPSVWARSACGGSGFGAAPLVAREILGAIEEVTDKECA
ncbi:MULTISPECIES: FAD-dependent oxidoreductase [unclassified Amycolatopsis]|uniref:NAD(P)/FAD-dependent oxidoreductase n=1 Tax=unclassified Amycolatopsis TaxID=2618356 RepID=UPI0028752E90|nr:MULTISPECIES: FAD-dependent oxidoreductase [unclassified Amycolatopsis]MDS0139432.1 FAD-binding oxidoreductase [Amycolatopsis sp. 505]MDS0147011.1 FAD-binding oxidoreductase [Amycolatopsis sp. CM201R]